MTEKDQAARDAKCDCSRGADWTPDEHELSCRLWKCSANNQAAACGELEKWKSGNLYPAEYRQAVEDLVAAKAEIEDLVDWSVSLYVDLSILRREIAQLKAQLKEIRK